MTTTPLINIYLILVTSKEGEHKLLSGTSGEPGVFSTEILGEAEMAAKRLNYLFFPNKYSVVQLVEVQS